MQIKIDKLSKMYSSNVQALCDVNLVISTGIYGLLGPNGAGKTTLMQILATLLPQSDGTITFNNLQWGRNDHEIRKILGYLPQYFGLFDRLTGFELLDYIGSIKGIHDKNSRKKMIHLLLEELNLQDKMHKKIRTYSGGMKQRMGIAQALIGDPKIVIIDEPTTGLDPEERVRFRNFLEELSLDRIILISTHLVSDIESSCSQLAIIKSGMVQYEGSPNKLIEQVNGKVWTGTVSEKEFEQLAGKGKFISRRKLLNGYEIRLLSDVHAFESAQPVLATLEDAYFHIMGSVPVLS